jgi:hypothetical protein
VIPDQIFEDLDSDLPFFLRAEINLSPCQVTDILISFFDKLSEVFRLLLEFEAAKLSLMHFNMSTELDKDEGRGQRGRVHF